MAASAKYGVLTSPGSTGNVATTGVGFAPAALILWTAYQTSATQTDGSAIFAYGFGTRDGGATQQVYQSYQSEDGATSGRPSGATNSTAILRALTPSATGTAVDFAVTLTTLDADGFTLNWTDLPATASIKVHYLALGGASLTGARAFTFTGNNSATQTVTVNTGFGTPTCVFIGGGGMGLSDGVSGAANLGFGVADFTSQRLANFWLEDSVDENVVGRQISETILARGTGGAGSGIVDQATVSGTATDGFTLAWSNVSANGFIGLALAGISAKVGSITSATSLTTVDIDAGFDPAAALLWGLNMPASAADITADNTANWGAFGIGATDFTAEGCAGVTEDDANATATTGRYHSETKVWQSIDAAGTPAVMGEADASVSTTNLRTTWTDADNVGRNINVVIFGPAAGGGGAEHERSASVDATGAITVANREFFSVFERAIASAAIGAVAVSAYVRDHHRQAATFATGALAVTAYQRDHHRQTSLAATGAITAAGTFFTTFERSASVAATAAVTVAGQRDLHRSASLAATGTIEASGQIEGVATEHERAATLTATGAIEAIGQRALQRSSTLAATGAISAAGLHVHDRNTSLSATGTVTVAYSRDHLRQVTVDATGAITVAHQRALNRSLTLAAIGAIDVRPFTGRPWNYDGTATATYGGTPTHTYDGDPTWTYEPVTG